MRWILVMGLAWCVALDAIGQRAGAEIQRPAGALRVAVTIDDLPWVGSTPPGEDVGVATQRLLSVLVSRRVPAVGFVNCARTRPDDPVLRAWRAAGMELGNHGSSHLDLHRVDMRAWIEDARSCHRMLTSTLGVPDRFFRFPHLHQGATELQRRGVADALRNMGYSNAHVTIDNSDFVLAAGYGRAVKAGDTRRRDAIAGAYREHMSSALAHFTAVGRSVAGRDVAHVLLLHANALAADHLGQVLDDFRSRGVEFVSLSEALSDPVYRRANLYRGPKGLSWLYRIDPNGTKAAQLWDEEELVRLQQQFGE